jgi:hypothetical protein
MAASGKCFKALFSVLVHCAAVLPVQTDDDDTVAIGGHLATSSSYRCRSEPKNSNIVGRLDSMSIKPRKPQERLAKHIGPSR